MRTVKLALLLYIACIQLGCDSTTQNTTASRQATQQLSDQQLFERKLECGKLLSKVEGSFLGPELHPQKGILPLNPVVFYSPRLNTCVLINGTILKGRMVVPPYRAFNTEHASLEDLLTGQTIESHEFDLTVPLEADVAKNFVQDAIKRYGPSVPSN